LIRLYNFCKQCGDNNLFIDKAIDIQGSGVEGEVEVKVKAIGASNIWINQKRDNIAATMWKDYQSHIQKHI